MKNKPHRFYLYILLRAGMLLLAVIPRRAAQPLAWLVGRAAYRLLGRYRDKTRRHLKTAFGQEKTDAELDRMASGVFSNLAQTAVDWVSYPALSSAKKDRLIRADKKDVERIRKIVEERHGFIVVTPHIGNWELLGAWLVRFAPLTALARRIYYEPFNRVIVDLRSRWGVRTMYRDDSPKEILKTLKAGEIVGILPDQDVRDVDGVFVSFFGRPAYTPTGPVRLALSSAAPIVMPYVIRDGGAYRVIVDGPIRVQMRGTRDETVRFYTEEWTRAFENIIRRYPDQWVWMHDRWKTRPPEECSKNIQVAEDVSLPLNRQNQNSRGVNVA